MAFLCPVRIRKGRKKRVRRDAAPLPMPGRITGSASIDTLVRVGLEKERQEDGVTPTRMVILHDFVPCVDDELPVKRGQRVNMLYRENDWVYVIGDDNQEGFIPFVYCAPVGTSIDDMHVTTKKSHPREFREQHSLDDMQLGSSSRSYIPMGAQSNNNNPSHSGRSRLTVRDSQSARQNLNVPAKQSMKYNSADDMYNLPTNNRNTNYSRNPTNTSSSNMKTETPGVYENYGCPPINRVTSQSLPSINTTNSLDRLSTTSASSGDPLIDPVEIQPFRKEPKGRYMVLFRFRAQDENDISVERGEFVTVLNKDDPDWLWVVRSDHQEGFVPAAFLCPAEGQAVQVDDPVLRISPESGRGSSCCVTPVAQSKPVPLSDRHFSGTDNHQQIKTGKSSCRLVCLYDFQGSAVDDLKVRRGEWIFADLTDQPSDGWLWAYSIKDNKYGFLPKNYVKPSSTCTIEAGIQRPGFLPKNYIKPPGTMEVGTQRPVDPYMSP